MNAISRIRQPYPEAIVLWQGGPDRMAAAIRIWHLRAVAIYFLVLLADGATMRWRGPFTQARVLSDEAKLLLIGAGVIALLFGLAWMTARTTLYTVTDRCVIMRFGLALQARIIIPFAAIERVEVRVHRDRSGDVTLLVARDQTVAYPKLWPHVRPWHFIRPEPMLRAIPAPGVVATIIARAVAARHSELRAIKAAEAACLPQAEPVLDYVG